MIQYIDKSAVLAEIEKRQNVLDIDNPLGFGGMVELEYLKDNLNTLEVKEVDTWHLQEKEDIYDVVKDWGLYAFACIMKDGTIQRFNGCLDEDCEGHVHVHIDGVNDDYDNVDDIVKWIEIT